MVENCMSLRIIIRKFQVGVTENISYLIKYFKNHKKCFIKHIYINLITNYSEIFEDFFKTNKTKNYFFVRFVGYEFP